jgi:uncharacterized protein
MPDGIPTPPAPRQFRPDIETLLAAAAGIILFNAIGFPAATLSGAMIGVCLLLAAGRKIKLSPLLRDLGMLLGGVAMGCSVTPEMLQGFQRYPVSLAIFAASIAATMVVTQAYLRRFGGWDRSTAFFAAAPGALTSVIAVAADTRADLLKVTMAQCVRLFFLIAFLPSVISASGTVGQVVARGSASYPTMAAMLLGGGVLAYGLQRLGMAAPWIFGGMVFSAILHGTGWITGDPPGWMLHLGFGLVGIYVATRFAQITRKLLLDSLGVSLGAFAVSLGVALVFAWLASVAVNVPFGQALLAFAPGGLEAMIILGVALGLDPIYVGLHHLVRFFGIGLLIPLSAGWADRDG